MARKKTKTYKEPTAAAIKKYGYVRAKIRAGKSGSATRRNPLVSAGWGSLLRPKAAKLRARRAVRSGADLQLRTSAARRTLTNFLDALDLSTLPKGIREMVASHEDEYRVGQSKAWTPGSAGSRFGGRSHWQDPAGFLSDTTILFNSISRYLATHKTPRGFPIDEFHELELRLSRAHEDVRNNPIYKGYPKLSPDIYYDGFDTRDIMEFEGQAIRVRDVESKPFGAEWPGGAEIMGYGDRWRSYGLRKGWPIIDEAGDFVVFLVPKSKWAKEFGARGKRFLVSLDQS